MSEWTPFLPSLSLSLRSSFDESNQIFCPICRRLAAPRVFLVHNNKHGMSECDENSDGAKQCIGSWISHVTEECWLLRVLIWYPTSPLALGSGILFLNTLWTCGRFVMLFCGIACHMSNQCHMQWPTRPIAGIHGEWLIKIYFIFWATTAGLILKQLGSYESPRYSLQMGSE